MSYPILAPRDTWYKGETLKSTITQINILDSYTLTGNETESWIADTDNNGTINCYITDTVLTIAGNGSGMIAMNEDASYAFSSESTTDYFSNLIKITKTSLLNFNSTKHINGLFFHCESLFDLDVSNWNLSICENFGKVFEYCSSLVSIYGLDTWDTSNGQNFQEMFSACYNLKELNLTSFNTNNANETYVDPVKNETTYGMWRFFGVKSTTDDTVEDMPPKTLKILKLGSNFNFSGNGINTTGKNYATLFTPDVSYIPNSEGCWFKEDETTCSYDEIPNLTEGNYYTSHPKAEEPLSIKYITLRKMGNAIRSANESTDTYTPDEMITEISKFSNGEEISADIVYDNSNTITFSAYIFQNMTNLVSVNAPSVATIEGYCFDGCTNLTTVNLPSVTKFTGARNFRNCTALTTIECSTVESFSGAYTFYNCTSLTGAITFPNLRIISGASTFTNTNFTAMHFPALTTLTGGWNFQGCKKLETITMPLVTSLPESCFRLSGSTMLTKIDLPSVTSLAAGVFTNQTKLETLILRSTTMCTLTENETVLSGTPIKRGTGYIYVPSALIDTYKADNLWSIFANQFRAIEDYPNITA